MISVYWYIFYGYNYSFDKYLNETCGRSSSLQLSFVSSKIPSN